MPEGINEIRFSVTDDEKDDLDESKDDVDGERTWREAALEDIAGYTPEESGRVEE